MTVKEFIGTLESSDRLRIIEGKAEVYVVYDRYLQITGYCKCCVDCNFIDQKGADELMCLAAYLAGNEQARAEAQQKAGKKA